MRVDCESPRCVLNTSASGSDFMFSCPPRQEAHGHAARNNSNGYTLVCPSLHVTVNSLVFLLAVMPVGFSFISILRRGEVLSPLIIDSTKWAGKPAPTNY